MRILYIYKCYFQRRKIYGQIMKKLGHHVVFLEKRHKTAFNSISINEIKKAKPDLIWFLSPFYVKNNPIAMEYIKLKRIPTTFYHGVGCRFPYTDWIDVWKQFTIVFSVPYDLHMYLIKNGVNSYHMPFGFHPTQYFKCIKFKKYNASFAGTIASGVDPKKDDRCRYLNSLRKHEKIVAYSKTFRNKLHKNIIVKGCKTHKQQRSAYAQSKINLDLLFFSGGCSFYKKKYHFRNRFFEIPATCNFMLTLRCPEFLNIFDEDTVGYYDDNLESFRESVDRYLRDDKIRKKMTKRAYKLVYEKHTFYHRFKEMFKIIES